MNTIQEMLTTKCELLCYGARIEERAKIRLQEINPCAFSDQHIHGAYFLLNGASPVNLCLNESFSRNSPYEIRLTYKDFVLFKNNDFVKPLTIIQAPYWYSARTSSGACMLDVFQIHGFRTLALMQCFGCHFYYQGEECLFCSFRASRFCEPNLFDIRETLQAAFSEFPDYSVALSGGCSGSHGGGIDLLMPLIECVREFSSEVPISVETAPPSSDFIIQEAVAAGATSIIMNIEFYDNNIRKILCPGKGKINIERYFESLMFAVQLLGRGKVSSVLIVGIENLKMTMECAERLIDIGVIPTLIPFRPYDNCLLHNLRTTDPVAYEFVSRKTRALMHHNKLFSSELEGCIGCGGCSVETV